MNTLRQRQHARVGLACAFLAMGSIPSLWSQDSLQVTFVGDRELYLREVDKPTDSPRAVDLGIERPVIDYAPIAKRTAPAPDVRNIAPIAVEMDAPLPRLYAGHARGGFGLYASPLLDIHIGDTRSRQGAWGLSLRHRSSAGATGKPDSIGVDEGWSKNAVNGYYRRFVDRSSVTASAFLERDAWGLHGLDLNATTDGGFSAPQGRQTYGRMGAEFRLQNHERDSSKVHRNLSLSYSRLTLGVAPAPGDAPEEEILKKPGRENLIEATGRIHSWRDGARYDLGYEAHIMGSRLNAIGDTSNAAVNRSTALVGVRPSVTKERGAYMIKAGAGLWVDARGAQAFHFYPMAEVRFRLLDDVFVPYGGVDGGMQRNALHDLVAQNPFLEAGYHANPDASRGQLVNTNRALELYGGVRGKLTRDLAFNAQARTTRFREFQYWVNEAGTDSAGQRFSIAHDSLTVASVIGEATYRGQGPLELSARAEFHTYGTGDQPYAWYQPRTRISASGRWNLESLLFIDFGIEIVGARYAPTRVPFATVGTGDDPGPQTAGEAVGAVFGDGQAIYARKLPAYTALDIGVEYRYNGRLSLGLEAKGPLSDTQIFNGYGAQRMGVMMVASYRF
jgi:hypothetical protein